MAALVAVVLGVGCAEAQAGGGLPPFHLDAGAALEAAGAPEDVATYAGVQEMLLRREWGPRMASLREAAEPASRLRTPFSSSDLDGDGVGDTVLFEQRLDETAQRTGVSLVALDGRTGQPLWEHDHGDAYNLIVLSPGDVTGDGAEDLFVVQQDVAWAEEVDVPCTVGCVFDSTQHIAWSLTLVSGPDGSAAWTRDVDGAVRYTGGYAGNGPGLTVARKTEARAALLDIRAAGDVDGDGRRDLLLDVLDYDKVIYLGPLTSFEPGLFTTRSEALAGDTGEVLVSRVAEHRQGPGSLRAVGDDLLWSVQETYSSPRVCVGASGCVLERRQRLELELVDGSGEALWTATHEGLELASASAVLTRPDLILVAERDDAGAQRIVAIEPADGAVRWTLATVVSDVPTVVGDRLLLWEGEDAPAEDVDYRLRLRRVDLGSGADVAETIHDLPRTDDIDVLYGLPLGDLDGDGARDLFVSLVRSTPSYLPEGTAASRIVVESGATGAELWRATRDRQAVLGSGGDLVPGGPPELLELTLDHDGSEIGLAGLTATGAELWRRTDTGLWDLSVEVARAPGGDEVTLGRVRRTNAVVTSRVDRLRGRSGVRAWGVGDPFGDPEPDPEATATATATASPTASATATATAAATATATATAPPTATASATATATASASPAATPAASPADDPPRATAAPLVRPSPDATPQRRSAPRPRVRVLRVTGRRVAVRLTCRARCRGRVTIRSRSGHILASRRATRPRGTHVLRLTLPGPAPRGALRAGFRPVG